MYSGSFAITAEYSKNTLLTIQGGINDTGFSWLLDRGERFITPQALLTYSDSGLGGMSRSIHRFIRDCLIDPKYAYAERPVVINNWEATYFDFDNEKLFAIIDEAAKLGIDTFVLDDGWFGDKRGLGDWFVNEKKLKGGLKAVIDRCKKNGLKFGLWFEPEMVNEDSDLYRAHPDWAIRMDGVEPCLSRNQLVLDFTRNEAVDCVYNAVSEILRDNDISYVKYDMNRYITECYSAALPKDRQGEFMHRYILGVYDFIGRLTSEFPDVFFEGDSALCELIEAYLPTLAKTSSAARGSADNSALIALDGIKLYVPLADTQKERERLEKELEKCRSELALAQSKLGNAGFCQKAPQKLIDAEREKVENYTARIKALTEKLV